ncbi:hypothetical protein KY290_034036 [Solanum tuberosum]|uniref:Gag-pol polyprotein n=1 Tax=Solanum tuberosum TaxID=4113 RepID=A0ABQ7U3F2_SOLTU|nr:hypothetical protein KY289_033417 [Solanum tuberosum]KAH0648053.1 hypothetical protein KY285_033301 [Solanum tuberosum]KAH0740993.1 hypothetical protein KY290_034036 [Solanum tuberosum]
MFGNAQFPSETASFMVGRQERPSQRPGKQPQRNGFQSQRQKNSTQRFGQANRAQRSGNQPYKNKDRNVKYNLNISCTYCFKTSHEEIDCFRLIGYPDDFQFRHSKEHQEGPRGNVAVAEEICKNAESQALIAA